MVRAVADLACALACVAVHALSPMSSSVVAPHAVTRLNTNIEAVSDCEWLVVQGSTVPAFLGSLGPAEVVEYNWNKVKSKLKPELAQLIPVLVSDVDGRPAGNDHADLCELTDLGAAELRHTPALEVWHLTLACAADADGRKRSSGQGQANCQRVCGGFGSCVPGCSGCKMTPKFQLCAARLHLSRTLQLVRAAPSHPRAWDFPAPP